MFDLFGIILALVGECGQKKDRREKKETKRK